MARQAIRTMAWTACAGEGLQVYRYDVDELLTAATRVRDAVSRKAAVNRDAELRALTAQVDEQVSTLEQYRRAYRELGGA